MFVGKTVQARRKTTKRPPSYYKNLRGELVAKGRTARKHADNTKKSKRITPQKMKQVRHTESSPAPLMAETDESSVRFC